MRPFSVSNKLVLVRVLTVLVFLAMSYLVFAQVFLPGYPSDWSAHLRFVVDSETNSCYSLFHFILNTVYKITNSFTMLRLAAVAMAISSNVISYLLVRSFLVKRINKAMFIVELLCLSLFLVSMIIIPFFVSNRYLGVGTPNPWHNPTYIVARPFAISSFILISRVNDLLISSKQYTKPLIWFSFSMLLSVLMKPSFFFVFLPALFSYFFVVLIRSKFKRLLDCFFLGLSVVPAGVALVLQKIILFDEENSIKISWVGELWRTYAPLGLISLAMVLGIAFPIYVTFINIKKLSFEHIVSVLSCIFGIMEAYFFVEDGPRYYHCNFFWGYYFSMFFAFLVSVVTFINNKDQTRGKRIFGYILYLLHLLSGVFYFGVMLLGLSYA